MKDAPARPKAEFFDAQYQAMHGEEAQALDHPLYRYLLPYATTRVEVAARMLGGQRFEHVVELGAGNGELIEKIAPQCERYDGFDISAYQLQSIPAALAGRPNLALHQADLEAPLPLPAETADLVVSLSTIEYLREPEALIDESWRVLRPGGQLLLHTMNLAFLPRRLQLMFGNLPTFNAAKGWQGGVLHQFTFPTLRRLLTDRGYTILQTRCAGLFPAARLWWKNALASDMLFLARKPAAA